MVGTAQAIGRNCSDLSRTPTHGDPKYRAQWPHSCPLMREQSSSGRVMRPMTPLCVPIYDSVLRPSRTAGCDDLLGPPNATRTSPTHRVGFPVCANHEQAKSAGARPKPPSGAHFPATGMACTLGAHHVALRPPAARARSAGPDGHCAGTCPSFTRRFLGG